MSERLKVLCAKKSKQSALSLLHSQYINGMSLPTSDVIYPSKSCEIPLIFFKTSLSITSHPINLTRRKSLLKYMSSKISSFNDRPILNIKSVICWYSTTSFTLSVCRFGKKILLLNTASQISTA